MIAQVVDASGKVTNQPEQHVHRGGLHVPARLPPGNRVRAKPQEACQPSLCQAEVLADGAELVCREKAVCRGCYAAEVQVAKLPKKLELTWVKTEKGWDFRGVREK